MNKKRFIVFIIVVFIIILVNILLNNFNFSIDFTKDRLYSLNKASKSLVQKLEEPITIKLIATPNLPPPFSIYQKYIKDIILQYKKYSRKKIIFEVLDANKNEDLINEYGLNPTQISVLEKDQTQTKIAYLNLVFLYKDSLETTQFIESTEGLEYNIDTIIKRLINKNNKLSTLNDSLNIYYIFSDDIYSLLPIGANELIPEYISKAVDEANKKLIDKVNFIPIDMTNPTRYSEILIKKFNTDKINWDTITDEEGNIIADAGSAYFSLYLENKNTIREIPISYILYGNFELIQKEILKAIDIILELKPTIGYIQGHNEAEIEEIPQQFINNNIDDYESISKYISDIEINYNIEAINLKRDSINNNINALMIVGSTTLYSEEELFKIDQFIMSGKPVFFVLNGLDISENRLVPIDNRLNNILTNYGVSIATNIILDRSAYKLEMPAEQTIYYIPIILAENINNKNDITKSISTLLTPMSSEIVVDYSKGTKITPLFFSSSKSWSLLENDSITIPQDNIDNKNYDRKLISVISEGNFRSAFYNNDIFANKLLSTTNGTVIVLGSVDMLKNTAYPANNVFLANIIDYMLGDKDIISIRRKGNIYNPPFQVSESVKTLVRVFNIVLVPLFVIIFGFILYKKDKKRKKRIYEIFNNGKEK